MKNGKKLGLFSTLVFGLAILGACSSVPKGASAIEPPVPDESSAVVYFRTTVDSAVWDGTTPVGEFSGIMPLNLVWKTTPGTHYFMANASNWIKMRAELEANKSYYVQVYEVPQPLNIVTFVAMSVMEPDAGEANRDSLKNIVFSDEWRAEYAQGKRLEEAQENLQDAMNSLTEVELSGVHGR